MKKKNQNLLNDPSLLALQQLAPTQANPNPRYAWEFNTVMPSDLIARHNEPGLLPLDESLDLETLLEQCQELRRQ